MEQLNLSKEDLKKFELIFIKYGDELFRVILGYVKDSQLAEDYVQEAFLQIARHMGSIGDVNSKESKRYIFTIAVNIAKKLNIRW